MRTKGYKCYNIKCDSCVGKTLCGEPEDAALGCANRVVNVRTKREQMLECMSAIEDGMCQTAQNSDIWQNRLIYALCKAVYLLLEDTIKRRN